MTAKGKTYTRVEHIVGDDDSRFHYIARYVEPDGDNRYDTDWYRTSDSPKGLVRTLLDACSQFSHQYRRADIQKKVSRNGNRTATRAMLKARKKKGLSAFRR